MALKVPSRVAAVWSVKHQVDLYPSTSTYDRVELVKHQVHSFRAKKEHLTGKEVFIDNLLVRIHLIINMILVDGSCAMGD